MQSRCSDILTASSFKDRNEEVKMNLQQEKRGSVNNYVYVVSRWRVCKREREGSVAAIFASAHNKRIRVSE